MPGSPSVLPTSNRALRQATHRVRVRPRWLEQAERHRAEEEGRERSRAGPTREVGVERQRSHREEACQRASAGRTWNRSHQAREARFQSTSGALRQDDGLLRSIGDAGFQLEQAARQRTSSSAFSNNPARCGLCNARTRPTRQPVRSLIALSPSAITLGNKWLRSALPPQTAQVVLLSPAGRSDLPGIPSY